MVQLQLVDMKMITLLGFEFLFCRAENFAAIFPTRRPNPSASIQSPTTQQSNSSSSSSSKPPSTPTITSLPSLVLTMTGALPDKVLRKFQRGKPIKFPLNEEATSLAISPTGRFLCAGFTDGTVRLFDLTGHFRHAPKSKDLGSPVPRSVVVDSKRHQRYGAVACQIYAKGVHTSLRMHVELSEDGLWCFAGVLRGSMELLAIYLGDLQNAYEQYNKGQLTDDQEPNLLDFLTVYRHSDAKLRGFGACTRLRNSERYLLSSGKSIKNIHIWSFDPPRRVGEDPVLTQIYDASTNGNTIHFLQFRRHATTGALQAISKSDGARLRVWDLTDEDEGKYDADPSQRPSRPPFQDVPNTEATLAVVGGFCICGGSNMYNQTSLVSLNVENLRSPFNHTEMALPGISVSPTGSSRRMQRGDLKSVQAAFGSVENANHVLLEISDDTLAHYRSGHPTLHVMDKLPWYPDMARTMSIGELPGGIAVAGVALYQASSGRGQLSLWALGDVPGKDVSAVASQKVLAETKAELNEEGSLLPLDSKQPSESAANSDLNEIEPERLASRFTGESEGTGGSGLSDLRKGSKRTSDGDPSRSRSSTPMPPEKPPVSVPAVPPSTSRGNSKRVASSRKTPAPRKTSATSTAPKGNKRPEPLITPTPAGKAGAAQSEKWHQLSLDSAAKTLSALKNSGVKNLSGVDRPLVSANEGKSPLPAPRVLHVATRTKSPQATAEETFCVTPTAGSKRGSVIEGERSQKRQKSGEMEWLRFTVGLRGRRDDQSMRDVIANECARLRKAIERKVDTLSHRRVPSSLSRTEKLKAEHQAAATFLEKKVWRSVRSLLQSLERSPSMGALRESEVLLQQLLRDYKATAVSPFF